MFPGVAFSEPHIETCQQMGFLKFPWFIKFPRSWRRSLCDAASEEAARNAGKILKFTIFCSNYSRSSEVFEIDSVKTSLSGISVTKKRLIIKVK